MFRSPKFPDAIWNLPAPHLPICGKLQVPDVDDSREPSQAAEEIQHRVVRTVGLNRRTASRSSTAYWQSASAVNVRMATPGSQRRTLNHQDELVGLLFLRHDRLQSGELLLQRVHFRLQFGSALFVNAEVLHLRFERLQCPPARSRVALRTVGQRQTGHIQASQHQHDGQSDIEERLQGPGPILGNSVAMASSSPWPRAAERLRRTGRLRLWPPSARRTAINRGGHRESCRSPLAGTQVVLFGVS